MRAYAPIELPENARRSPRAWPERRWCADRHFVRRAANRVAHIGESTGTIYTAVIHSFTETAMLKQITRIGNSQGLILDTALMELTGLNVGDQVSIAVASGGTIILTPIRKAAPPAEVSATIRRTVKDYRKTLKKLA